MTEIKGRNQNLKQFDQNEGIQGKKKNKYEEYAILKLYHNHNIIIMITISTNIIIIIVITSTT